MLYHTPVQKARWREALLVLLLGAVATTILFHPFVLKMDRVGRVNTGDGQFSLWNVAWVAESIVRDPANVYNTNIFWPHKGTLAWSEANLGAGVLAIPGWWATRNPYFAHNSVLFVAFVLSVSGAYALARHLTGHPGAAAFASLAFAFCPFIYARTAHIQLMMTAGLPWSLWACHRLIDAPSAARALALGGILFAQALSCAYYGIFAGLSVGLAVLFFAAARRLWRSLDYWIWVTVAAVVAVGLVVPFFLPYLAVEEPDFQRTLDDAAMYSAGWRTYLASSTWAHRWMLSLLRSWVEVAFPGFLTAGFAAAALWMAATGRLRLARHPGQADSDLGGAASLKVTALSRPRETVAFYGLLAALAAWLSTGPNGGLYTLVFHTVPVFGFLRAPGRFGILVALALVMCAAVAIAHVAADRRRRWLPFALTLLVSAELMAAPLPVPEVDPAPHPVYRALARLPRGPVCEFPFFYNRPDFPRHAYYMLNSTAHWQPLVNGYSDHIPDDFRAMVIELSSFPARRAFELLRERRTRYVVFHLDFYDVRSRAKLLDRIQQYAEFLTPLVRHEDVWLYEIADWPQ